MKAKILLVEDNTTTRELLKTILGLEGYEVVAEANNDNPDKVLDSIRMERPALILMDFYMGEFDGLDMLTSIRQDDGLQKIPIIISSGADVYESCLKAGASAFIMKPFSVDQLIKAIKESLAEGQELR